MNEPAKTLVILNEGPYGSERSYHGLRLAVSLAGQQDSSVRVFLIGEAVACAKQGQQVPPGHYNVELMLMSAAARGAEIGVCGTSMDARGIGDVELSEASARSAIEELTEWTLQADRVLVF